MSTNDSELHPYNAQIPTEGDAMQAKLQEQLSLADTEVILGRLSR